MSKYKVGVPRFDVIDMLDSIIILFSLYVVSNSFGTMLAAIFLFVCTIHLSQRYIARLEKAKLK